MMKNIKYLIGLFVLTLLHASVTAQQTSKTKAKDKIYEKGGHKTVFLQNAYHINTKDLEFSPVFYQNGIVYVTSRDQEGNVDKNINEPFFELFYAETDKMGMPINAQKFSAKVNSQLHEGPTSFSSGEDVIYYTSNSQQKKKDPEGKIQLKIYQAKKNAFEWIDATELPFNSNNYTVCHPTISKDGKNLYFVSNMPGGFGGMDIYFVEKTGETWGLPLNMGAAINTAKDEAFPFLHESGKLFFASMGLEGLGGYDIFAVDTDGLAVKGGVINLGEPFNSTNDDLGFILNKEGTQGFLTSARYGGLGKDDIYMFNAPDGILDFELAPSFNSMISVFDAETEERIEEATVYIFEQNESGLLTEEELYDVVLEPKEEGSKELVMRMVLKKDLGEPDFITNNNGEAVGELIADRNYFILVSKEGYENKELLFSTKDQDNSMNVRVPLSQKKCAKLSGIVVNEKNQTAIGNARVRILNNSSNSEQILEANTYGQFEVCLPINADFSLSAEKDGYIQGKTKVATTSFNNLTTTLRLTPLGSTTESETSESGTDAPGWETPGSSTGVQPVEEGSTIVLENIYYDFNKSAIRAGAAEELDALVSLMKQYPDMEIELIAHTDARGGTRYNMKLSKARAKAAKNYLITREIDGNRITAIGKGETELRNRCDDGVDCSDKDHQYNRRTEVRVIKMNGDLNIEYKN